MCEERCCRWLVAEVTEVCQFLLSTMAAQSSRTSDHQILETYAGRSHLIELHRSMRAWLNTVYGKERAATLSLSSSDRSGCFSQNQPMSETSFIGDILLDRIQP